MQDAQQDSASDQAPTASTGGRDKDDTHKQNRRIKEKHQSSTVRAAGDAITGEFPESRSAATGRRGKASRKPKPRSDHSKVQESSEEQSSGLPGQHVGGSSGPRRDGTAPRHQCNNQHRHAAQQPSPPPGLTRLSGMPPKSEPHPYRLGQGHVAGGLADTYHGNADSEATGKAPRHTTYQELHSETPTKPSKDSRRLKDQRGSAAEGAGAEPLPDFRSGGFLDGEAGGSSAPQAQTDHSSYGESSGSRGRGGAHSNRGGRGQESARLGSSGRGRDTGAGAPYQPPVSAPRFASDMGPGRANNGKQTKQHAKNGVWQAAEQGPRNKHASLQTAQQAAQQAQHGRPKPQQAMQQAQRDRHGPQQTLQHEQHGKQGSQQSSQHAQHGRRTIFVEHLAREQLQRGLKSGELFKALFRCNPADRSQGFCTVAGLPSDVFIRGSKAQNRSMEGDEVVIRILPPERWYQLTSAKQQQQELQPSAWQKAGGGEERGNVEPTTPAVRVESNVVSAAGLRRGTEAAASPVLISGTAPVLTSPGWEDSGPALAMGDLVASPALRSTPSGGELAFALGPAHLSSHPLEDYIEESSEVEEGLSEEEQDMVLEEIEEEMQGLTLLEEGGLESPSKRITEDGDSEEADGQPEVVEAQLELTIDARVDVHENPAVSAGKAHADSAAADTMAPAQQAPQDGAAGIKGDEAGHSTLELVLKEAGRSSAALPRGARQGCWHASGDPEAALKLVAQKLGEMCGWRAVGEVVAVVQPSRRREAVIGVLKQEGPSDATLLLFPCDPRMPRMLVRSAQLPPQIREALKREAGCTELSSRTLVSAHVTAWECHCNFPFARVCEGLGSAGDLASETRALLEMENITDDDQFTPEVLACLPPTPWSISEEELARRRDFRQGRVFSIDPSTARDLDDALSLEELGGGLYRVGVHIADVSHFVRPDTSLDEEAQHRSTSVYLVDRVIPMLPRLLCEELCSLNPGVDRLSFSIVWDMTEEGDIQSTWVGRSVIRSCGKLAYPMVQSMIDGEYLAKPGEEPPCDLHGPYTWPQVVSDSLMLSRIARNLRRRRFESGALRLDNVRLYFKLDAEGNPEGYGVYEQKESNQLVEEFMLLANMTAARMVADAFPDRALLRCHPPPNEHKMGELSNLVAELGYRLDISSAGALQESLQALRAASGDAAVMDIITLLATKPMQVARYFCTGETPDQAYWRHYALAVSHYTHFTSPIRRYPDIIVHRLLAAAIDTEDTEEQRVACHGLKETREVGMIAAHSNARKLGAKSVQDGSLRLYLCVMLHRQPIICDGVVSALGGSRFFDLYLPALGMDVRVHTDSVLKGGNSALESLWDAKSKVLTLERKQLGNQYSTNLLPDYSEIPNFDKVLNPSDIKPMALPVTLRMLTHVAVVVSSRKSQISGSPTHVMAKLLLE